MVNKSLYFILSASCKLVRGLKRCVIIDYAREDLYFITHEYLTLIKNMNRKQLIEIENNIDDDSKAFFDDFLENILSNEIGFLIKNPNNFPEISNEPKDDYIILKDVIIEIDEKYFNKEYFKELCKDLNELRCEDFEIRLLSIFNLEFLDGIIKVICSETNAYCIEIHCSYNANIKIDSLHHFIEENPLISKIFVYNSPENNLVEIVNNTPYPNVPVPLGEIFFLNYEFKEGNCCGIINKENLNFSSFYLHNQLKKRNGCLDRKISIDRYGNIKNCPSMKNKYGNIKDVSIKDVIQNENFRKYWFITKDQISICKVCEFRYNCTDCRAFLQDRDDIYSKPLKCGYNPATCKWEDWSTNPLKEMDVSNNKQRTLNP